MESDKHPGRWVINMRLSAAGEKAGGKRLLHLVVPVFLNTSHNTSDLYSAWFGLARSRVRVPTAG